MIESNLPSVTIVILNWNTSDDTRECLHSLRELDYPKFDVILLDNGSKGPSVSKMVEYWKELDTLIGSKGNLIKMGPESHGREPENVRGSDSPCTGNRWTLLLNDKNYGFAEGNNIGIRYQMARCRSDYYLLLNNDTVVDPSFLRKMIDYAESNGDIGVFGPMILYYDYHGRKDMINMVGGKVDIEKGLTQHLAANVPDTGQYAEPHSVDYVEGSCMLIRTSVMERIGMLNANYFAYWEETDFCVRAKYAGIGVAVIPSAKIWHKVSVSTKGSIKSYYFCRNRFWFVKDHADYKTRMKFCSYYFSKLFWYELLNLMISGKGWTSYRAFAKGTFEGMVRSSRIPIDWDSLE